MQTIEGARGRWVLALALICAGCSGGSSDDETFTAEDRALIRSMVLDPSVAPPIDVSNDVLRLGTPAQLATPAFRAKLATLGQQLFFDRELSTPRADGVVVACADCHIPSHFFSDPRPQNQVSQGLGFTARNSPSLVNVGYYVSFGWDGRADSLWGQGKHAFESGATMKGDKLRLAQQVARRYQDRWSELFGKLPDELQKDTINRFSAPRDPQAEAELEAIYKDILKVWGAYLLTLVSGDAPFDLFARGDDTALDPAQRRGLHLFLGKAGCISCHLGPNFTDNLYHSVGVGQDAVNAPAEDLGRFTGLTKLGEPSFASYRLSTPRSPTAEDKGLFRTKSLRQVAETAPYFHAGQAASLADVVWFYNQGGEGGGAGKPSPLIVPLGLTELEQADVVAFLGALTGKEVPPALACNNSRSFSADAGFAPRCAVIP